MKQLQSKMTSELLWKFNSKNKNKGSNKWWCKLLWRAWQVIMELRPKNKGFFRKPLKKARMKHFKTLTILIQMPWHMSSSFNLKREMEKSIKDLHNFKLVKLKKNNGWKRGTPMRILAQYALIHLKDSKSSKSCKSAAMSTILSVSMNGLKMKKDALFVTNKFYDLKLF